ncbi:hypothetical protein [Mucilaginibacter pedocola]|nr:hypothetical protein [Mucilaginibacter pedocola]
MNKNKTLQLALAGLVFMVLISACKHRNTTIISTNDNGNTKRIEYSGQVVFSKDHTGIDFISDGGYVKFERMGKTIAAENDGKGKVVYVYDGGHGSTTLDADGKQFLAEAVQEISKAQAKLNR